MKIYQPTKGKYTLPRSVYYRIIYLIKDYPRILSEADALLEATPPPTETPEIQRQRNLRAPETSNIRYAMLIKDVRDIEDALAEAVPYGSRDAVMANILNGTPYPVDKSDRSYQYYKQKFIHTLAVKRQLI